VRRDWACIPQSWTSTKTDPRRPPQKIGFLSDAHKTIANQEVAKQFYIYTLAKEGVIWLRDITWATGNASPGIQRMIDSPQRGGWGPANASVALADAVAAASNAVQLFQHMKLEEAWYVCHALVSQNSRV
jgi:hypothetical protein